MVEEEVAKKYDSSFTAGKNTVQQIQAQVDTATQEVRRVYCLRGPSSLASTQNFSTISQREFPFPTV
jgi:hypothetical protein